MPELVVKITREPGHNDRLLNEERALREVARRTLVDPGAAPEVLFSAEHGGLRLVGESAIEGTLLTESASPHAADDAYRWLIELSVRSAQQVADAASRRAAWIEGSSAASIGPMTARLDKATPDRGRPAAHREIDALPIVFAHGDAAAWNVLVQPNDRVAFLDWEAADAEGMPLWDVFHFARSHVIARARVRRLARRPGVLLRSIVEDEGSAVHGRRIHGPPPDRSRAGCAVDDTLLGASRAARGHPPRGPAAGCEPLPRPDERVARRSHAADLDRIVVGVTRVRAVRERTAIDAKCTRPL